MRGGADKVTRKNRLFSRQSLVLSVAGPDEETKSHRIEVSVSVTDVRASFAAAVTALRHSHGAPVLAAVFVFAVVSSASFGWIYGSGLAADSPIRSDAMGYYLFLPAVLIDRDVTMERTAQRSFAGRTSYMSGVRRVAPRGRYLDKYPVGEALMLLPFFATGHAAAILIGSDRNGFSTPYQVAAATAGLVYALLGVAVLGFFLLRWFSKGTVFVTLLAVVFGTNLFHYSTFDAVFSHAFSFFLVAVILNLAVSTYERPELLRAGALGLAMGLLTAVRPTNAVILVFVALVGIVNLTDFGTRLRGLRHHLPVLAAASGAFLLALIPQSAYWYAITGDVFVYAYGDEHLTLFRPHLPQVLFSVRKGLFFWSPLLLLAVAGLPLIRRFAAGLLVPSVAYLVVNAWVISSWQRWSYGGSLGQRAFVEALPVFSLGLAALIETVRGRTSRRILLVAIGGSSLIAMYATVAYWLKAIPYDGTTLHIYLRSFHTVMRDLLNSI